MKNVIPKFLVVSIIILGFFYSLLVTLGLHIVDSTEDYKLELESHLGDTLILENDTTTIIDYSMFHEHFILNNGKTVSTKLINKD
jgi:phosphotransferase system  glucose/maltose/N-acetylglucosamine-specific IIC component